MLVGRLGIHKVGGLANQKPAHTTKPQGPPTPPASPHASGCLEAIFRCAPQALRQQMMQTDESRVFSLPPRLLPSGITQNYQKRPR